MSYNEKQFTSDFNKFIKKQYKEKSMVGSACFEIKVKPFGKRLNFRNDFQDQQLPMLEKAQKDFVYHKISDMSVGMKPFDSFILNKEPAYVVVLWYRPRRPKSFVMINIKNLLLWKKVNNAKSITEEEAMSIGTVYTL